MKYSKELFWSKLQITINSEDINEDIINKCFLETESFEMKYSRFIKWNYLENLNNNKSSQLTWELLSIIKLSEKVSNITKWYFDITVLPLLENIWYWIHKGNLDENIWYKNIEILWDTINLKNWVSIDIWAVWKWYIVDKIYNMLDPIYDDFIINFWWDIRIKWKEKILLEDPYDDTKSIWEIYLNNLSIASSSPFKRKTKKWNHLINPISKKNDDEKVAIYLTHKLSSFSDIFSTALFITPIEESIKILNNINGLEWMIITKKWEIFKSKWFNCKLNK